MHRTPSQPLNQQFRTLGAIRALAFKYYWEASVNDDEALVHQFLTYAEGVELICQAIGLEFHREWLFNRGFGPDDDPTNLMPVLLRKILFEDRFSHQIRETFGKQHALEFLLSGILMAAGMTGFFQHTSLRAVPSHRRAFIKHQRDLAHEFLTTVGKFLRLQRLLIRDLFEARFAQRCEQFADFLAADRTSLSRFQKISPYTEDLLDDLIPHFNTIDDRLERASSLITDLDGCEPGPAGWRSYEEICLKCLRFLFMPPFRKVLVQARTAKRDQQRDAVLPNNQFDGFWKLIKEEFETRHVVCEFKNVTGASGTEDLNQLRLYLSKPTVGRFGLLFTRNGCDRGFAAAQRNAYEQQRILVLLITDSTLVKMLKARAFIGSADFILEDLKAGFEIAY